MSMSRTVSCRRVVFSFLPMMALFGAVAFAALPKAACAADDGLVRVASPHTVDQTIDRLRTVLTDKGVRIFADIDHTANAAALDLAMPDTHLLIFGSPKIGAPLMSRNPAIGLDLPIKALVYADDKGRVWVVYNDPAYLASRYGLPADLKPFNGMRQALEGFVSFAVKN